MDGNAYLILWSPAQGFHADHVVRGPAHTVKVEFESQTQEVSLAVTCVNGVPQGTTESEQRSTSSLD
jgi:hypothetical protein